MKSFEHLINEYFSAQEQGDERRVAALFVEGGTVQNALGPVLKGKDSIKAFCTDLRSRTSFRKFAVRNVFGDGDALAVEWQAVFGVREGSKWGNVVVGRPFELAFEGVSVFHCDRAREFLQSLRIYHETSSIQQALLDHSGNEPTRRQP